MAKRKRAPGGGRKPMGDISRLDGPPLSIRMPADFRKRLEWSRTRYRPERSMTQEILSRLERSFLGDRPSITRHLCFLIAEIAVQIEAERIKDWNQDAFVFQAFKAGVESLLNKMVPGGPQKSPFTAESDLLSKFKTADELGEFAAASVWSALMGPPDHRPVNQMIQFLKKFALSDEDGVNLGNAINRGFVAEIKPMAEAKRALKLGQKEKKS